MSITRIFIFVLTIISMTLITVAAPDQAVASDPGSPSVLLSRTSNEIISNEWLLHTPEEVPEFKSKLRARLYSAAATTIPLALARFNARGYRISEQTGTSIVLISSGILVGPSAGSIYADDWTLAKRSILVRSASAAVMISGHFMRDNEDTEVLGSSLLISSGLLLAGHALYDMMFLSAHSVDYHNAGIRLGAGLSFHNPIPQAWKRMSGNTVQRYPDLLPGLNIRLFF